MDSIRFGNKANTRIERNFFEIADKTVIVAGILRIEGSRLGFHLIGIPGIIQHAAVVKVDAVEGVQVNKIQVIRGGFSGRLKYILDDVRRGNQGRAHVEGVAVFDQLVGMAPDLFVLFDQGDLKSAGLKTNSRGQSPESGTDNHDLLLFTILFHNAYLANYPGESGDPDLF